MDPKTTDDIRGAPEYRLYSAVTAILPAIRDSAKMLNAKLAALLGASLMLAAADPAAAFMSAPGVGVAAVRQPHLRPCRRVAASVSMVAAGKRGPVLKALKKPTGALTVSVELSKPAETKLSELELTTLSMQLRKFKAASMWTADLEMLAGVAAEQKTAKGNFPGPCPLIFNGDSTEIEAAAASGAAAVVLGAAEHDKAEAASKLGLEVIWSVDNVDEVAPIVDAGFGDAFILKASCALDLVASLPKVF